MMNTSRLAAHSLGGQSGLVHGVAVECPSSKRGQASGYEHFSGFCCLLLAIALWGRACHISKHTVGMGGDYTVGTGVHLGRVLFLEPITAESAC